MFLQAGESMTVSEGGGQANRLHWLFFGPAELRAGWRLLIFAVIVFVVGAVARLATSPARGRLNEDTLSVLNLLVTVGIFLASSAAMAKFEGRKIADYGLPWRRILGKQFWQGTLIGFPTITTLVAALHLAGGVSFTDGTPQGSVIWMYAVGYGLFFVLGAVFEEFFCRGYLLFTLTTGIGFWPAAGLTSVLFGALHAFNPGETAFGCFSAGVFGLLLCLMLRRSGNLWMSIGFHSAYNWGEAFFYGTPDSGQQAPERFLTAKFAGPDWLTGGSAGPEGSYLCVAIVALVTIAIGFWLRTKKFPDPVALRTNAPTALPASAV
jgi:membrane protease YdiL (CAAX protease family)